MQGQDLEAICRVIGSSLCADAISAEDFAAKVFLDLNFSPETCLVAEMGEEVVGFLAGFVRRYPIEDMPSDADRSWITLFAVAPEVRRQGIATALFDQAEQAFMKAGRSSTLVGPYTPSWWTPGVDEAAYPGAIRFLEGRGYKLVTRPLSMRSDITVYSRPEWVTEKLNELEGEGYSYSSLTPQQIPALFDFLKQEFPGDWQRHLRQTARSILDRDADPRQIHVVQHGGVVKGFSHFEGERFGPFGTAASLRGKGLGVTLLCITVEAMKQCGAGSAFFMWTSDQSARIYSVAGFRESRRFSLMKKDYSRQ